MAIPAMIAGSVLSAVGAVQEGRAADAAGQANQKAMNLQADSNDQAGAQAQQVTQRSNLEQEGRMTAAISQSNIDPTAGSAFEVLKDSATNAQLNLLNTGWDYHASSQKMREGGAMAAWEGKQARKAGYIKGATAILSGISSVAGQGTAMARASAGGG